MESDGIWDFFLRKEIKETRELGKEKELKKVVILGLTELFITHAIHQTYLFIYNNVFTEEFFFSTVFIYS